MLTIQNAKILTPFKLLNGGRIDVENGNIVYVGPKNGEPPQGKTIDASGLTVVPGFIDLQINGGFGHNFTEDPGSIWQVAPRLPQFGVTAFLPTIVTSPLETVAGAQEVLTRGPAGRACGAAPLGLHVEGPFLNPQKKGAHLENFLRSPDLSAVQYWSREDRVWLVTVAPELPGALAMIRQLVEQGVVVSAGHTMATYAETKAGIESGVRYGTHLYNAMRAPTHREPGVIGALLRHYECTVGLICDGVHVHPAVVDQVWQVKGDTRLNLVSDATSALGCSPGVYQLGGRPITVTEDDARLADGTLAGSMASLDQCLRNFVSFTGISLHEALPTITSTPAELMSISHERGQLEVGMAADMVLLTHDLRVHVTIINGRVVYQKDQR